MIKYRPEIDGLRAVAVIPVILFHLGFEWINGGYYGVDVFFVISGFLITSIILKELNKGVFSMLNFWKRRIRRILPLLLTVIITVLAFSFFMVFRPSLVTYANDALAATFSYANISLFLKFSDYWGSAAESSPFLHTWSLAVEEQFYLIYPFVILLLFKFRVSMIKSLIFIIVLSFCLFLYGVIYFPNATFFLLPTRAWELAMGGLIGVLNPNKIPFITHKIRSKMPIIGLLLILVSYILFTGNDGIGVSVILPVIGSAIIIAYCSKDDFIGNWLSKKPFVFIGKLSYSLYLWHWPIIVFANFIFFQFYDNNIIRITIILILTIFFSLISYYLVEKPTRKSKHTFKVVLGLIASVLVITIIYKSDYLNKDYPNNFKTLAFYGVYYDITPTIKPLSEMNRLKREGIIAPERDSVFAQSYANSGIVMGDNLENPEIMVLGDSHGAMWAKVIDEIGEDVKLNRSFYTAVGNQPFFKLPLESNQKSTKGFSSKQRDLYAFSFVSNLKKWSPSILIISCRWTSINDENKSNLEALLELTIKNNVNVILINQPPFIDKIGNNNGVQYLSYLGYKPNGNNQYISLNDTIMVNQSNAYLRQLSDKYNNTTVFDVNSSLRIDNKALIIKDDNVLYYDDDHLSYQGTSLFKKELKQLIKEKIQISK